MVIYNPKDWVKFVFRVDKADTLYRTFPVILVVMIYSLGIAYWEINWMDRSANSWIKNIPTLHTLVGVAISILLVFRTNSAYDRWWEGRKLWGSLVNNSRNLAIKLDTFIPENDTEFRDFFREHIPMYASVLRLHLQSDATLYDLDERKHPELILLDTDKHAPNQVAKLIFKKIHELFQQGLITGEQFLILNNEFTALTDICGACERIKNTPIPFAYSAFIRKFLFIYILTLPLGYVYTLGYYVAPIVGLVTYVFGSMEFIAEEIEDPFGLDKNDLPLEKLANNIKKHIGEII